MIMSLLASLLLGVTVPQSPKTELFSAIPRGDAETIGRLLQGHPQLASARNEQGLSALMTAVYYQKKNIVELLLATGMELDIFEASSTGSLAQVRALLQGDRQRASVVNVDGFFPLGLAAFFGHPDVVELLLTAGADPNQVTPNDKKLRPLHAAAASGNIRTVSMLLARGADPNLAQEKGFLPLHEASLRGDVPMVELLLRHGADVGGKTDDGRTALTIAEAAGKREVVEVLTRAKGR